MTTGTFFAAPLAGRHVLFALMGFFGVMVAVNAAFLYFALTTFNGIEAPDAYRRGLQYNAVLAEAERQQALGWTGTLTLDSDGIVLVLKGSRGEPVTGMAAVARLGRPATNKLDSSLVLAEARPGLYTAVGLRLPAGAWIADIAVSRAGQEGELPAWRKRERLWLTQQR